MEPANTMNYTWEIFKIFLGLGFVLTLVYLLSHLIKNSSRYLGQRGSMIRVLDRGVLTQHSQVQIIQVGEKYYLLGVTDEQVTVLDTFTDLNFVTENSLPPATNPKFADILRRTFGKRDGGDE